MLLRVRKVLNKVQQAAVKKAESMVKAEMEKADLIEKVRIAKKFLGKVSMSEARTRLYENIKEEFGDIKRVEDRQKLYDEYSNCRQFMELWEHYRLNILQLKGFVNGC